MTDYPILMLTAMGEPEDRIAGLIAGGAPDPARVREVLAMEDPKAVRNRSQAVLAEVGLEALTNRGAGLSPDL